MVWERASFPKDRGENLDLLVFYATNIPAFVNVWCLTKMGPGILQAPSVNSACHLQIYGSKMVAKIGSFD
jgi:hypothetical protein